MQQLKPHAFTMYAKMSVWQNAFQFNKRLYTVFFLLSLSLSDVGVWSWLLEHINFDCCPARVGDIECGQ